MEMNAVPKTGMSRSWLGVARQEDSTKGRLPHPLPGKTDSGPGLFPNGRNIAELLPPTVVRAVPGPESCSFMLLLFTYPV